MRVSPVVGVTAALAAFLVPADSLHAAPPAALVAATSPSASWIVHEVIPGERLADVADRYAVATSSIVRWNKLDTRHASDMAGQRLRIQTQFPSRQRDKLMYTVRPRDSWSKIARRYSVDPSTLQHVWNREAKPQLQPGDQVLVWVEPGTVPNDDADEVAIEDLVVPVPIGARSFGRPDHGRLLSGVLIPENPALYTVRDHGKSYGSTHAIEVLQRAIAAFRINTDFDGEILLWDMSVKRGGRFGPHRSHRSGRDVDIALPLKPGLPIDAPRSNDNIDWQATWQLVRAFIETNEVRYIFLGRARQKELYKTALANGATREELETLLQFPRRTKHGIIRHSPGHTVHLHVRISCGSDEPGCVEL